MLRTPLLVALVFAAPGAAWGGAMGPPPSTFEKFVRSEVVVVGTVTAIEKATVDAPLVGSGAKEKYAHTVAVVKLDAALVGATGATHVTVGFVPPKLHPNAKPFRGSGGVLRTPPPVPELKVGQEVLLFLVKHPTADFYAMPDSNLPTEVSGAAGKTELDVVKKCAAIVADPMKGLASDKADVRAEAAAVALVKYRAYPEHAAKIEEVAIPADESKLILKALADGDWSQRWRGPLPNALNGFYTLRLTEQDGWTGPTLPKVRPGDPPPDLGELQKKAFAEWLAGPGKDYRIKKVVPKK